MCASDQPIVYRGIEIYIVVSQQLIRTHFEGHITHYRYRWFEIMDKKNFNFVLGPDGESGGRVQGLSHCPHPPQPISG